MKFVINTNCHKYSKVEKNYISFVLFNNDLRLFFYHHSIIKIIYRAKIIFIHFHILHQRFRCI